MGDKMLKTVIVLVVNCFFIISCQQNGEVGLEGSKVSSLNAIVPDLDGGIVDPDDRDNDTQAGQNNPASDDIEGICGELAVDNWQVSDSEDNRIIIGIASILEIIEPLANVNIVGVSGAVILKSVLNLETVNSISGNFVAAAKQVGSISSVSGSVCLKAESVGRIGQISGPSKIIANSIDSLENVSGVIHIHKAQVASVKNSSAQICLYGGASVLQSSGISGSIQTCD
jgi:hypothetical protein